MLLDVMLAKGKSAVLGHRGSPLSVTENTLGSFVSAVAAGADGVELDVHLSKDGVPVVCHDPELETASGERVAVREASWSDLADLDVVMGGKSGRLCKLDEVFDAIGGHLIDIELKDLPLGAAGLAESPVGEVVARLVVDLGAADRTVLTSFYLPHLKKAERTAPDIERGWLLAPNMKVSAAADLALAEGMSYLLPHISGIPLGEGSLDSFLADLRDRGLGLIPWTVNDPMLARRLQFSGAAGVITDDPRAIAAALRDSGAAEEG